MGAIYSPLCDTDVAAYLNYLASARYESYQQHGRDVALSGFRGSDAVSMFGLGFGDRSDGLYIEGCSGTSEVASDGSCGFGERSRVASVEKEVEEEIFVNSAVMDSSISADASPRGEVEAKVICGLVDKNGKVKTEKKEGFPLVVGDSALNDVNGKQDVKEAVVESNRDRNRRWRQERKEKKQRRKVGLKSDLSGNWRNFGDGSDVKTGNPDETFCSKAVLEASLRAKYVAQNELAVFRAKRDLEVMKAVDLSGEVRRQQTKINAHTEKNMVAIERAHGLLKSTGNVPGEGILSHDHDVHTVIDGSPGLSDGNKGSISPDSSASQAEFRACQKSLLDAEAKIQRFEEMFSKLNLPCGFDDRFDKETFTDNTDGAAAMEIVYPGLPFYEVDRDGVSKMKVGVNFD